MIYWYLGLKLTKENGRALICFGVKTAHASSAIHKQEHLSNAHVHTIMVYVEFRYLSLVNFLPATTMMDVKLVAMARSKGYEHNAAMVRIYMILGMDDGNNACTHRNEKQI